MAIKTLSTRTIAISDFRGGGSLGGCNAVYLRICLIIDSISVKLILDRNYGINLVFCAWVVVEWGNTTAPMAAIPGTE